MENQIFNLLETNISDWFKMFLQSNSDDTTCTYRGYFQLVESLRKKNDFQP